MLENENRDIHAENLALFLLHNGHFYLYVQRKTNAFLDLTDAFGSFRRFRRVVTCYNWASRDVVASPFCLQICFDCN